MHIQWLFVTCSSVEGRDALSAVRESWIDPRRKRRRPMYGSLQSAPRTPPASTSQESELLGSHCDCLNGPVSIEPPYKVSPILNLCRSRPLHWAERRARAQACQCSGVFRLPCLCITVLQLHCGILYGYEFVCDYDLAVGRPVLNAGPEQGGDVVHGETHHPRAEGRAVGPRRYTHFREPLNNHLRASRMLFWRPLSRVYVKSRSGVGYPFLAAMRTTEPIMTSTSNGRPCSTSTRSDHLCWLPAVTNWN